MPYISHLNFLLFGIPSCFYSLPRNEHSLDAALCSLSKASILFHVAGLSSSIYSTYTNHFIFDMYLMYIGPCIVVITDE